MVQNYPSDHVEDNTLVMVFLYHHFLVFADVICVHVIV